MAKTVLDIEIRLLFDHRCRPALERVQGLDLSRNVPRPARAGYAG
ncbi:MAG: hypothetical protein H6Q41_4334 [Deltaproteobacteria bacterium]|jgi:hypothetical protein|nr:hypothetical protein [Deltaproteobacteria bacterium]